MGRENKDVGTMPTCYCLTLCVASLVFPTFSVFKVVYHEHPFAFSSSAMSAVVGGTTNFWGAEMFDFRRTTLFCLEKRLSKHKMTICSKNLGGVAPLPTPVYAYVCQSCRSLRNESLGGRILGLIRSSHHSWLIMLTSSEGSPLFSLASGPPTLNPPLHEVHSTSTHHLHNADW